jgi:hypothetical protein
MGNQNDTNDNLIPEPLTSTLYIPGYLKTQIGKLVKVEFLIGNASTDRTGVLVNVGVSYIIIRPIEVNGLLLCDLYSIKFVTIVERPTIPIFGGFAGI